MRWKIKVILLLVIIVGCTTKEEPVKTFTARQVVEGNVFSYGSIKVRVNSDLDYLNVSGSVKKDKFGVLNDPTIREFHIFTRPGKNMTVLIETHTRRYPDTFQKSHHELTKKISAISRGRKPIDGQIWEVYVRALPEFPEQIISAVRQKGIRIEPYRCGLEIGAARAVDRYRRIYISFIRGVNECQTLPRNDSILSDEQARSVRELSNQFDEHITISDQSGG